jgi:hypothetical protein
MRWLSVGVVVLSVSATAGCPSEFGKDGRIGKAVHKDSTDMAIRGCSDTRRDEVCAPGRETSQECLDCGGKR